MKARLFFLTGSLANTFLIIFVAILLTALVKHHKISHFNILLVNINYLFFNFFIIIEFILFVIFCVLDRSKISLFIAVIIIILLIISFIRFEFLKNNVNELSKIFSKYVSPDQKNSNVVLLANASSIGRTPYLPIGIIDLLMSKIYFDVAGDYYLLSNHRLKLKYNLLCGGVFVLAAGDYAYSIPSISGPFY